MVNVNVHSDLNTVMKYTEDPYMQTNSIEVQTHAVLHYPHYLYIAKISAQNPIMH